jgi:glycerol kinase
MPDTPVAGPHGPHYDPLMEARISRLEEEMREEKTARARLEVAVLEIKTILTTILPHLATKADIAETKTEIAELRADLRADLAEKPSKTYVWGVLAVLLTAYACGLAALAVLK